MATTETRIKGTSICTYLGKYVNPLDLEPEDIDIRDIAHALSNQCRFSGHTKWHYSVAQHSVLVADVLKPYGEEAQIAGLLHDSAEAYLQDVARPLKEHPTFGQTYRGAERRAEKVISEALGSDWHGTWSREVKEADMILLATERRDLMAPGPKWAILDDVPLLSETITQWSPFRAETKFLLRYQDLTGRRIT